MTANTTSKPRIAFVGTGAQGASIGADFALAGFDVTFIEQWPAHVEAIREKGITVNLPTRTINAKVPAFHFCQVAEIKKPFDLIFLIVKAYDTKWVTQYGGADPGQGWFHHWPAERHDAYGYRVHRRVLSGPLVPSSRSRPTCGFPG